MEVYYKDLISEEASLDKLVDSLTMLVQGADEFAEEVGAKLQWHERDELVTRLQMLKEHCRRIKEHAVASALAADRVLHEYPYSAAGFAFAFGLVLGATLRRKN